jgi:hypothetical protein
VSVFAREYAPYRSDRIRLYSAKSRGCEAPQGDARSSSNTIGPGLYAAGGIVLSHEDARSLVVSSPDRSAARASSKGLSAHEYHHEVILALSLRPEASPRTRPALLGLNWERTPWIQPCLRRIMMVLD